MAESADVARVKPTKLGDVPLEDQAAPTFNPDDYAWADHLKTALEGLKTKKIFVDRAWRYYEGDHPKVWLTDAIRDKLDDLLIANMAENWCDVAVDAPVKRLSVEGWSTEGAPGKTSVAEPDPNLPEPSTISDQNNAGNTVQVQAADNVWTDNDLELAQKEVYTSARAAGESFVFGWKDDGKEFGFDITINDARNVWWPDDAHRSKPTRVVKVWADEYEGIWRATCYYKYVVVRLIGPRLKDGGDSIHPQSRYFIPDPIDPGGEHGFEEVPIIRFALQKKRRSVIDQITTIQDKINKLSANMMVNGEFNAFRKMAILTEQTVGDDDLKMRPNRALVLDPGGSTDGAAPTSIWESSETNLGIIDERIDRLIDKLFTKADLPGHLKIEANRTVPSGAAYEADEGPFVESILDMQKSFGASWIDLLDLLGIEAEPQWRNPSIKSDFDEAQTVKQYVDAGLPIKLALKYYAGWTDKQLTELDQQPLTPKEQQSLAVTNALTNGMMGDPNAAPGNGGQQPPDSGSGVPNQGTNPFGNAKG